MLLTLLLLAQAATKAPTPKVADSQTIALLRLQRDELAAQVAYLRATVARLEGVYSIVEELAKSGCVLDVDEKGAFRCKMDKPK